MRNYHRYNLSILIRSCWILWREKKLMAHFQRYISEYEATVWLYTKYSFWTVKAGWKAQQPGDSDCWPCIKQLHGSKWLRNFCLCKFLPGEFMMDYVRFDQIRCFSSWPFKLFSSSFIFFTSEMTIPGCPQLPFIANLVPMISLSLLTVTTSHTSGILSRCFSIGQEPCQVISEHSRTSLLIYRVIQKVYWQLHHATLFWEMNMDMLVHIYLQQHKYQPMKKNWTLWHRKYCLEFELQVTVTVGSQIFKPFHKEIYIQNYSIMGIP